MIESYFGRSLMSRAKTPTGQALYVENAEEIIRRLRKISLTMSTKAMRDAMKKGAAIIYDKARAEAPVGDPNDPGYRRKKFSRLPGVLRRSIIVDSQKDQGAIVFLVGVEFQAFYGRFLEFGTKHMGARPWMKPALKKAARPATRAIIKRLQYHLKRMESVN